MAEDKSWGRANRRQRRETARELAKELVRQHLQEKGKFRTELTLALAAIVIGILLVLIAPQSKWTTGVWLVVVFGFGVYPMLHLGNWALKNIKWEWLRSVLALIAWAAGMTLLALSVCPRSADTSFLRKNEPSLKHL
ncbi:MAG: hypothetical protein WA847_01445 [Terriglobales bacterium]